MFTAADWLLAPNHHMFFFSLQHIWLQQARSGDIFSAQGWLSIVIFHFLPLLTPFGTLSPSLPSPRILPCSPCLAFASSSLNRLAPCQSRGLLWLHHKSARKNRNHLFKPGLEHGWVYKYRSLAFTLIQHAHTHTHARTQLEGSSKWPNFP